MRDPAMRESFSPNDAKFLEIVDKYGWHVMSVAPRANSQDRQEWFSYSTGLFMRVREPEIILCGLDSNVAVRIINEIGHALESGRKFKLETDYTDIFANDVKCHFRAVHLSQYGEYVCWSQWFYESKDFPVWQCFWPDKGGHYPWEAGCHPEIVALQPSLYEPLRHVM